MEDLDALAVIYRDPEVRRYFPEGTLTYEETKEELEWIIDVYYGQYGFGLWATLLQETNEFIGRCGLLPWTIEGRSEVEVAYLLAKPYWGAGAGDGGGAGHSALRLREPAPVALDLSDRPGERGFHQSRHEDRNDP
jgi:hypothetical protein